MARIYKRSDRITVKIDDISVRLAPLTLDQKTEIQMAMLHGRSKTDLREVTRGIALSIKYTVKGIEGIEDSDGPYQLQFENEVLTDACVDDLMNLELSKKLTLVCASMVTGIPSVITDNNNTPLEGVEVVKAERAADEKKI